MYASMWDRLMHAYMWLTSCIRFDCEDHAYCVNVFCEYKENIVKFFLIAWIYEDEENTFTFIMIILCVCLFIEWNKDRNL